MFIRITSYIIFVLFITLNKKIELLHLFGKPNQNDLVIQGMHSNIKGNKMFFDSAERLKNEISFIEKEKKKYKK